MKYDITKPLTKGAKRTLDAFSREMFMLLSEKSFEEITVGQLCEAAQYPRATFYNYFDDKYDLLHCCWQTLAQKVGFSDYHHAEENEMLYLYFDRTVSRRSEPSSRTTLIGEQPNPWDRIQPQDAMSRHRGAKPPRRCGLLGEISLLSPG